jgi:ribosomal protein L16 Arg81 hydroxylase
MRNAASTLEELVEPLTEAEFLAFLRERKLVHLRAANNGCYAQLVGWNALRRLIEDGEYPRRPDYFRVAKESMPAPIERWVFDGKVDPIRLEECLADGFSIIITHLDQHVPSLGALCRNLSARLLETTYVGAIVTTGAEGAFRLHYDYEDLIILQVEGTKRWQIFGPPVLNPIRGIAKQSAPQGAPIFDEVLEPGDFLFVPAGNWHHCQTMSGKSIHLGIFFTPPTGWHAARALTSELLSEEVFRTPLTRVEDASELAALEAAVKKRLIEKVSAMKLCEFRAEWSRMRNS